MKCAVWLCMTLACLNVIGALGGENFKHTYKISEEQRSGTFVGNVARDTKLYERFSQEQSQWLRYSVSNQGSANFRINATMSGLWTQDVIDREKVCHGKEKCEQRCDVNVYLENADTGRHSLEMIVRLTVVIVDINDNTPEFPESSISLTVLESKKVGDFLITSPAHDPDLAENSVQSYTIIPDDGIFELKLVNNAGISDLEIVIKKSLDRETRDSYEFVIVAEDGGSPRKSGSVTVVVTVTDVNDNRPLFTEDIFEVTVNENMPIDKAIVTLEAADQDAGLNRKMSFHFSSRASTKIRSYFSIDEQTGEIYPMKVLDYEDEKQHRFTVEVRDGGSPALSSQAEVVVNVADVNDNSPKVIVKDQGGVRKVSEDAGNNTFIAHVNVVDLDSNENGHVTCTVSDSHFRAEKFTAFSYYKILLQEQLDFEEQKTFSVNITCRDNGTVPRSNSTSITVQVLDVNDNSPIFATENITAFITENNDKDQLITTVMANDADGDGNNEVSYAIVDGNADLAYINTNTGEIRATDKIDREHVSSFTLKIEARDNGYPPMSSFATVTVTVDDVNDHAPEFSKSLFVFEVPEGRPVSTLVGKLNAIDDDASPRFIFSLVSDDVADIFTISSTSGEIITRQNLDRLVRSRYHFTVMVMDAQEMSFHDTANVTVYIVEDRSTPPTILFPRKGNNSVSIPFDSAIGSVIFVMKTENRSSTKIRKVKFLIEHGNENQFFNLDEDSGNMTLAKALYLKDAGTYKLLISTYYEYNLGQKSFVTVDIVISSLAKDDDEDRNNYIVVVIIIVCVTGALAVAIMLAICMMKRVDQERRESRRKRKEAAEKVYHVDNIENIAVVSDWNKEERLNVMVKPQLSFKEEKELQETVTPKPTTNNQKKIVQFAGEHRLKVEDDVSNLSAEADSGHGGSEEDFNSNGRLVFLHADSDSSHQNSHSESFEFRPETSILSTSSLRDWLVETPKQSRDIPLNPKSQHPNTSPPDPHLQHPKLLRHVSENLPRTFSPSVRPRSFTPVTDVCHVHRERPRGNNTSLDGNSPTRKTSLKSGQKSVRFNIEDVDNGTSNI